MNNYSNAFWRKGISLAVTYLLIVFVIFSCKKKENPLGQGVIDQNELLSSGGVDTFSLKTFSYFEDSTVSDNAPFVLLGSYTDPVFGTVENEFYTQIRLSGNAPDFEDLNTIIIDSFILGLEYIGHYGNAGDQHVEVFEIGEDIYVDSTYYSFQSITDKTGTDLVMPGENTLNFDVENTTVIGSDTVDSQLRIPLDTNFARALMVEAQSGGGNFIDNDAFVSYFKGLHIKTNNGLQPTGTSGVFYFNINDPLSKLTIYYRIAGVSKTFDFIINSNAADFNQVTIDNSMTKVGAVLADNTLGQMDFYTQSFGSRARVLFNGIDNLPKTAVIHKAVLELPVSYQSNNKLHPGVNISVATFLESGSSALYSINSIGEYNDFTKKYEIDLRSYVQAVINGDIENHGLVLSPVLHHTSAIRIEFNGPNSGNKEKPKLSILYTEF